MTTKTRVQDSIFRFKLYLGAAALGGFIAAVFYPMYLFHFPEADLIQIFRIIYHVFQTDPTRSWLVVACAAGLSFWLAWVVISQPWRGAPPEADGGVRVKKPW